MKPNQPHRYNCGIVKHQPGQAVFGRFVCGVCLFFAALVFWGNSLLLWGAPILRYIMGAK